MNTDAHQCITLADILEAFFTMHAVPDNSPNGVEQHSVNSANCLRQFLHPSYPWNAKQVGNCLLINQ